MLTVYAIWSIKLVHVLAIATWFGPKVLVGADLRRAIADGASAMQAAVHRVNLVQKVAIAASMVALASGLVMIFLLGGFGAVEHRIHLGLALTLALFGLGAFGVDKAWKRIREAVKAGHDKELLSRLERRLSRLMSIEDVIWVGVLMLMVFRFQF
jgi:hypothetical protein